MRSEPDPERQRLLRSSFVPSSLNAVAISISVATEAEKSLYVERIGNGWRWSFVHAGGPYPLLRLAANFLKMDHHGLVVGSRKMADGIVVLARDPSQDREPDAWCVLEFAGSTDPEEVKRRIATQLIRALRDRP